MDDLKKSASQEDAKLRYNCFMCERYFQYGSQHVYDGKYVRAWNIMVCRRCYDSTWDGIVIEANPKLVEHLKSLGIEIKRNAKGWVDWP